VRLAPGTGSDERTVSKSGGGPANRLLARVSRLEWVAAAIAVVVLGLLALAEPDILEAPFENDRTVTFTVGGTTLAAVALVVMLWLRVHPVVRLAVLGVPFVAVSWWLLSPFFIDEVVDDEFATSIAEATGPAAETDRDPQPDGAAPGTTTDPGPDDGADPPGESDPGDAPRLLGTGRFVGLAGHDGSGDAGFFSLPGGGVVLRLESFDIDNGPDLRLYVVPGADQTSPGDGSLSLGRLRGNVGDQTYGLPAGFVPDPGDWTVLVWCEAFDVEFVAATVTIA
jgi:hypothetical protein